MFIRSLCRIHAGRRDAGQESPAGHHPVRWPRFLFEPGAPRVDKKLFDAGVPVLGICYGFQAMAYALGADVDKAALGEYGKTETTIDKAEGLLDGSPAEQSTWMSHGVAVKTAPEGFEVLAHTEGAPVAAMQDESRKPYGVQWHPEVKHTPMGQKLIEQLPGQVRRPRR